MSRTLPLPSGTYTLLPLIDACDNFVLPVGPWSVNDLRARWIAHQRSLPVKPTGADESALDSDDDEHLPALEEFLAPFFLTLPTPPSPPTPSPRRPSSASSPPGPSPLPPVPTVPQPIGFLRPCIVEALIRDNAKMASMSCRPVWKFLPPIETPAPPPRSPTRRRSSASGGGSRRGSAGLTALSVGSGAASVVVAMTPAAPGTSTPTEGGGAGAEGVREGLERGDGNGTWAAGFEDWVVEEGSGALREHMDRVVRGWKMGGLFKDQLDGWRDEEYAIYGPHGPFEVNAEPKLPGGNFAFSLERAACGLFGVATYGVHCTAYIEEPGEPLKFWIPRRSATKATWPSYLDTTVGGGITSRASPHSSILRECAEEASLPESITEPLIRSVSLLSYTYRTPSGWIGPEVQFVYDLKLPPGVAPKTNVDDGEVESFMLMEIEEVVERMCAGEFKANCALVMIDFFIRHAFLTPESDSRYLEVATRLRRPLVLPGPI